MKKRKVLVLIAIGFLILVLLFISEDPVSETTYPAGEYSFEDPEKYEITEKSNIFFLENKLLGFSFEISNKWIVEGFKGEDEKGITLFSSDYKENESFIVTDGCKIIVTTYSNEEDYLYLQEIISFDRDKTKEINGHLAYKESFSLSKIIKIPVSEKIHSIEGHFSKEECKEEYNNLLKSISFDNEKN